MLLGSSTFSSMCWYCWGQGRLATLDRWPWLTYTMSTMHRDCTLCFGIPHQTEPLHSLSCRAAITSYFFLFSCPSACSSSFKELRGRNDFLGKAHISLEDLPPEGEDSWFDLQSHHANPRGRVQMKLHIINVVRRWKLRMCYSYMVYFNNITVHICIK